MTATHLTMDGPASAPCLKEAPMSAIFWCTWKPRFPRWEMPQEKVWLQEETRLLASSMPFVFYLFDTFQKGVDSLTSTLRQMPRQRSGFTSSIDRISLDLEHLFCPPAPWRKKSQLPRSTVLKHLETCCHYFF